MSRKLESLVCFVDKSTVSEHSFVSDFLVGCSDFIANKITVVTTRSIASQKVETFIKNNITVENTMLPRRGLGRLLNFFIVFLFLLRARVKGDKSPCVLVRNCPFMLLGASLAKAFGFVEKLVYQNSFPHEALMGNLGKYLFVAMLRISSPSIDGLLAVSPKGLIRVERLFGDSIQNGAYIPLCCKSSGFANNVKRPCRNTRFVYVGTLAAVRELHVVVEAFISIQPTSSPSVLYVLGGTEQEFKSLMSLVSGSRKYQNRIVYCEKMSRDRVLKLIKKMDVGLSAIPAKPIYSEASPTKLSEYMVSGLAVVASNGIELQDQIMADSACGLVAEFSSKSIGEAMAKICNDSTLLESYKTNSASQAFIWNYANYTEQFIRLFS